MHLTLALKTKEGNTNATNITAVEGGESQSDGVVDNNELL